MSLALSAIGSDLVEKISHTREEPGWLTKYRMESLSVYDTLPIETSPLYSKYTDVKRMDPQQVSIPIESDPRIPAFLRSRLAELKGETRIVQVGTHVLDATLSEDLEESGLILSSIGDALRDSPDLVRGALESTDSREDKFTALNNAAFNTGLFIHVPRGLALERPIHILSSLSVDGTSAISRNIISAAEASHSSIVQEIYSPNTPGQQAYMELLNTQVAADAKVDATTLQVMDDSSVNFSTRRMNIGQNGTVNWYLGLFGAMLSRYRIDYHLNGQGASANDSEVVFGSGGQSFDIQANVNHVAPHSEARVNAKSILRDSSKSLFKGMIRILEGASKSNSFLSGRSILLDPDAKSEAIPGLEIFTNDVKATHSASVAQIDEEQIFYLQSRCLSKRAAERTIVEGFLEPLSRKMSYQVRAWIAYLIESKWEGKEMRINTDKELTKFVEVEETRYNEDAEIEQHYKYR
jgi:Fe-S cluster assembly protein SufB/Fe-S cluster assembly protein SufD